MSGVCFTQKAMKITICVFAGLLVSLRAGELKSDLASADPAVVRAAVEVCVEKGKKMLPDLRKWATSDNPSLRFAARKSLGAITGQWASQTDLVWERDFDVAVASAKKQKKPLMVLQLFGDLDAEFC